MISVSMLIKTSAFLFILFFVIALQFGLNNQIYYQISKNKTAENFYSQNNMLKGFVIFNRGDFLFFWNNFKISRISTTLITSLVIEQRCSEEARNIDEKYGDVGGVKTLYDSTQMQEKLNGVKPGFSILIISEYDQKIKIVISDYFVNNNGENTCL